MPSGLEEYQDIVEKFYKLEVKDKIQVSRRVP